MSGAKLAAQSLHRVRPELTRVEEGDGALLAYAPPALDPNGSRPIPTSWEGFNVVVVRTRRARRAR